jgi:HEAT repeat protein
MEFLYNLYIRLLIWLGAAPPPGYEYLVEGRKDEASHNSMNLTEEILLSNLPNREQIERWIYDRNFRSTRQAQEADRMLNSYGEAITPTLIQIVRERGYHTIDAIEALVNMRAKSTAPVLMEMLKDAESLIWDEMSASAAWALGKLQVIEAIPVLIRFANENSKDNRAAAIEALGNIGEPSAIPALETFLQDRTVLNRVEYETYWLYRRYRGRRVSDIAIRAIEQIGSSKAS